MVDSQGPRAADVRDMLRLCHTLHTSADAVSQKTSLLAGLCNLLEADNGVSVVAHVMPLRRRENVVSVVRYGASRACEKQLLARCLRSPGFVSRERVLPLAPAPDSGVATWHPLNWPARSSRSRRLRHCLWTPAVAPEVAVVACVCIARGARQPRPFLARERMLLHLAHVEMSWIYQADLLPTSGAAATLSPRQRQTLQFLLAGHSEKEIAEIMRLSRNTVHHHVKALHRHFGVSSRSELLAKWVRSD